MHALLSNACFPSWSNIVLLWRTQTPEMEEFKFLYEWRRCYNTTSLLDLFKKVNTTKYKVFLFLISGSGSTLVGALWCGMVLIALVSWLLSCPIPPFSPKVLLQTFYYVLYLFSFIHLYYYALYSNFSFSYILSPFVQTHPWRRGQCTAVSHTSTSRVKAQFVSFGYRQTLFLRCNFLDLVARKMSMLCGLSQILPVYF